MYRSIRVKAGHMTPQIWDVHTGLLRWATFATRDTLPEAHPDSVGRSCTIRDHHSHSWFRYPDPLQLAIGSVQTSHQKSPRRHGPAVIDSPHQAWVPLDILWEIIPWKPNRRACPGIDTGAFWSRRISGQSPGQRNPLHSVDDETVCNRDRTGNHHTLKKLDPFVSWLFLRLIPLPSWNPCKS